MEILSVGDLGVEGTAQGRVPALIVLNVDDSAAEAIGDRLYWLAQVYRF